MLCSKTEHTAARLGCNPHDSGVDLHSYFSFQCRAKAVLDGALVGYGIDIPWPESSPSLLDTSVGVAYIEEADLTIFEIPLQRSLGVSRRVWYK